jgi:glutamine amidotransferase
MCRHLAYLGPVVPIGALLVDPPHALLRQSWAPRRQRYGTVNADGFGIGWYAGGDPVPARYRSDRPMWTDPFVRDLGRVVRTGALLAAVRSGTEGMPYGAATAAPFAEGPYLFSHNGAVPGWPASVATVAGGLTPAELLTLEAPTDSAFLWLLVRQRLAAGPALPAGSAPPAGDVADAAGGEAAGPAGDGLAGALAAVTRLAAATGGGRLNLLATDGHRIAATTWGDTLCWRADARGVVVASEPFDDEPGWNDVPDRSVLTATPDGVAVVPLQLDPPAADPPAADPPVADPPVADPPAAEPPAAGRGEVGP